MNPEKEINEDFKKEGYPPPRRTETQWEDDDLNFKKFIVTPQEPVEYVKDTTRSPAVVYELPRYTPTMALGNLDTDREAAMRDDFYMFNILSRYGYHNRAKQCLRDITDRVISSQSHLGKMIDNVTEQHFSMRREEFPILENGAETGNGQNQSPIQKFIENLKAQPQKMQQRVNETRAKVS